MNNLLPLLVGIPLLGGCALLLARRLGLPERAGELLGQSFAFGALALSILCALTARNPAVLNDAATSTIVPFVKFAPEWLRLEFPAAVATNVDGWQLSLGLDGLGLALVLLTTITTCAVLIVAETTVERNRSDFAAWILIAMGGLLLAFGAMDLDRKSVV